MRRKGQARIIWSQNGVRVEKRRISLGSHHIARDRGGGISSAMAFDRRVSISGFYPGFKTLSPNLQEAKDAYVVLRVLLSYLARGRGSPLTCKSQLNASTKCSVKWPVCCALSSDFTDQPTEKGGEGGQEDTERGGKKGRVA